jgi:hypothetical protein
VPTYWVTEFITPHRESTSQHHVLHVISALRSLDVARGFLLLVTQCTTSIVKYIQYFGQLVTNFRRNSLKVSAILINHQAAFKEENTYCLYFLLHLPPFHSSFCLLLLFDFIYCFPPISFRYFFTFLHFCLYLHLKSLSNILQYQRMALSWPTGTQTLNGPRGGSKRAECNEPSEIATKMQI